MANNVIDQKVRKFEWSLNACCFGIALLILGLFLFGLARPLLSNTMTSKTESRQLKKFLEKRSQIQARNEKLIAQFIEFDQRRENIMARIPDRPNESIFLSQITQAAENCGLIVQEFRPSISTKNERFSEMEIEVSSQGNYVSLCRFLEMIEELPRYTLVSELNVDTAGSQESLPVQMTLRIFYNESEGKVTWRPNSLQAGAR